MSQEYSGRMGLTPGRHVMGLLQFTQVCHMFLPFLASIWNKSYQPCRIDDTFFESHAQKKGNEKDVFLAERCKYLEGLDEKREEA